MHLLLSDWPKGEQTLPMCALCFQNQPGMDFAAKILKDGIARLARQFITIYRVASEGYGRKTENRTLGSSSRVFKWLPREYRRKTENRTLPILLDASRCSGQFKTTDGERTSLWQTFFCQGFEGLSEKRVSAACVTIV